jgi:hypothetical protein
MNKKKLLAYFIIIYLQMIFVDRSRALAQNSKPVHGPGKAVLIFNTTKSAV